jgi:hypothetical protein
MKPVDQTILAPPDGNCFAACLASILEMPLAEVPNYKSDQWVTEFNAWLKPRGLALLTITLPEGIENMSQDERRYFLPGYCILAAQSPRYDCLHAVVVHDGEIVHDPHPERHMGVKEWKQADMLVALNAARVARLHKPQTTGKPCVTETRRVYSCGTFRWNHNTYRAVGLEVPERFTRYGVGVRDDGSVYLRKGYDWVADAWRVESSNKD